MDSKPDCFVAAAACLAVSAALFFFGTGLAPAWPCTWLAAVPVLWMAPRVSGKLAFPVSAAAYALGGLNEWRYSRMVIPAWLFVSLLLFSAALFGLGVLLFRGRMVRGRFRQAVVVFPAFWVTVDYLVSIISVHGTFGDIGYSQMNFLPIVQIASVTGIWGISFCMFLFAAAAAMLFSAGPAPPKIRVAVAAAIFLVCVFVYGTWRLAATPGDSPTVKTALLAGTAGDDAFAGTPEQLQRILGRYAGQMKALASQGIQLFVIPEHTGPVTDASQPEADALLRQVAQETGADVAVGIQRISPDVARNQERLYSPDGAIVVYNKHHLLPPFENRFKPDTKRSVVTQPSGKWGIEICKDMDFPRLSREYSGDGIGLLIVSAADFVTDGWLHGRMAVLRGVESGFSVARSANRGILTSTDDRGRVLAEQDATAGPPFVAAIAEVPVRHDKTLYALLGDWFAWLCIALLLLSI